jgi:hypothetical protein
MGPVAVEPDGTSMIYCLACGTANEDGSKFCDECGDQLAAQGAKRGDVPPWVTEMEATLRTQAESGDDGEPQEIREVPDWFRDLQASQPDRYVEEAFRLGVGENGNVPAWLASVQGLQTSAEPPEEPAEPLQAEAEFTQVDGDTAQTEADIRQAAAESQQPAPESPYAVTEPPQAVAEPPQAPEELPQATEELPQAAAQPPWAPVRSPQSAAQLPRATAQPPQAEAEPTDHAPKVRKAGEPFPEWPHEARSTAPESNTDHASEEGYNAEIQSAGWVVETQAAEGAGEPEAPIREGNGAEKSPEVPGDPRPAAQDPREDGALTGSEGSDRLSSLQLRALRDKEGKLPEGMIELDQGSAAGEWLPGLVESLPVQASIVQVQGAAVPERETAHPDRFASRARVFSEIVSHPPEVAPVVTAQPKSGSRSRPARYALYVVLIVIAIGAILAIAFGTRLSLLVGWIQSILENLGGLIGG